MDLDTLASRTLQRTWDLHQRLYVLLESAVEGVNPRFDPDDYDPWYFTHSIRHDFCRSIDAIPETERHFTRHRQPLSAIELHYKEFRVKVWKTSGEEMPIAGNSVGREGFLKQPFLENYLEALGEDDVIPLKLFIAWDTDKKLHLSRVDLVCPRDFESPWKPGNHHFCIPVPHPAAQILSPRQFTEEPTEVEVKLERTQTGSKDGRRS
jgi:hypothetical protein